NRGCVEQHRVGEDAAPHGVGGGTQDREAVAEVAPQPDEGACPFSAGVGGVVAHAARAYLESGALVASQPAASSPALPRDAMMDLSKSRTRVWLVLAPLTAFACGDDDADVAMDTDAETASGATATAGTANPNADDPHGPGSGSGGDDGPTPPTYPEDEIEIWELRTNGFAPPVHETWYSCFSFSIDLDRLHHIIGFEPVVTHPVIHHYILSMATQPIETDPNEPC